MPCAKFSVRGRVQGVAFRAYTREQARRLGLTGYARNLADRSVEVLACGGAAALGELERWLQHGPPAAWVESVVRTDQDVSPPENFTTA
jgi:acylphosphatase